MQPGHHAFLFAWTIWDRLFKTQVTATLARAGIECPQQAPPAWDRLFRRHWAEEIGLQRKQTFFSMLALEERPVKPVYYRLSPLTLPEEVSPKSTATAEEARSLSEAVGSLLQPAVRALDGAPLEAWYAFLQAAAQWAMSRVAFHQGIPHLSLYDVAATAGAIETCLHFSEDVNQPYVLASVDLSGIQKYIFAVEHSAATGVAKRLRSRSFFLSVFLDSILLEILERLGLSTLQVISRAGGQAQLLLPNTDKTFSVLRAVQEELDQHSIQHFEGLLCVHVAATQFSDKELHHSYSQITRQNSDKLRQRKQRALENALIVGGAWDEEAFLVGDVAPIARCQSCHRLGRFEAICSDCERDAKLGTQIPRSDRVYLIKKQQDNAIRLFGRWSLTVERPDVTDDYVCLSFQAIPEAEPRGRLWWSERTRHVAQHPWGGTLEFTELAARSKGKQRVAYVKADIDRLGLLFAFGIPSSDLIAPICQVRGLSAEVDAFTSGYVQRLLTRQYPDTYTIFAGGDDIAIVAPWHQGVEIASRLRMQLALLAGRQTEVTLSAAVRVVEPLTPITFVMEMVEGDLEQAKGHVGQSGDRDQVTLFGRTMSWREAVNVIKDGFLLQSAIEKGILSTSVLHDLQALGIAAQRCFEGDSSGDLRYRPLLHYQLTRWEPEIGTDIKGADTVKSWLNGLLDPNNPSLRTLPEAIHFALLSRATEEVVN